jgi:L-fuculose-phosphate aldolase
MAVEVEALAQMYLLALTIGEPPVLSDAEMDRVIAQMRRMSYGQGPEGDGAVDVARLRG